MTEERSHSGRRPRMMASVTIRPMIAPRTAEAADTLIEVQYGPEYLRLTEVEDILKRQVPGFVKEGTDDEVDRRNDQKQHRKDDEGRNAEKLTERYVLQPAARRPEIRRGRPGNRIGHRR